MPASKQLTVAQRCGLTSDRSTYTYSQQVVAKYENFKSLQLINVIRYSWQLISSKIQFNHIHPPTNIFKQNTQAIPSVKHGLIAINLLAEKIQQLLPEQRQPRTRATEFLLPPAGTCSSKIS
jgi:hypothetical protein